MAKSTSAKSEPARTQSWVRQNLIEVAPLWAHFLQTAFANVRISVNERSSTIPSSPLKPSRRIDAVLTLDPDDQIPRLPDPVRADSGSRAQS